MLLASALLKLDEPDLESPNFKPKIFFYQSFFSYLEEFCKFGDCHNNPSTFIGPISKWINFCTLEYSSLVTTISEQILHPPIGPIFSIFEADKGRTSKISQGYFGIRRNFVKLYDRPFQNLFFP